MAKKIAVLHFYKAALPESHGGVEVFMDSLCNGISDFGVNSTILALARRPTTGSLPESKYRLIQAKQNISIASTGISIAAISKFYQLAASADLIHYHFPYPFADLLHFCCRISKPSIVTYHSDIIKQRRLIKFYLPLMRHFLRSVQQIVATSPVYLQTSPVLQQYKQKTTVIPLGINLADYPQPTVKQMTVWRSRFTRPFFLFIGALRYYKGLKTALAAIAGTDLQLVIAGTGSEATELQKYSQQLQLRSAHFIGSITEEDKIALLKLCTAFVFPSNQRSEAFGIALLEAAALAKPMISCEIGTGTSFVNIDKLTGLVVKPNSPSALRQAMLLLLQNPEQAKQFGKNANTRYRQLFTASQQTRAYLQLYRQVLARSASGQC